MAAKCQMDQRLYKIISGPPKVLRQYGFYIIPDCKKTLIFEGHLILGHPVETVEEVCNVCIICPLPACGQFLVGISWHFGNTAILRRNINYTVEKYQL